MEQRLCVAAIRGRVDLLKKIIEEDELILDKIVVGSFKGISPLHVAASRGQKQFVEELLNRKPELAQVLDSRQQSALHLASAEGHVEIVKVLAQSSPEMCLALDRDGRNPLHLATMKGRDEVLQELVQFSPHAARANVDCGGTILHLCVKHNRLTTLEKLFCSITDKEFINYKDSGGKTVLHLAVLGKQIEMVKLLLENKKIDVNATNANVHTALDILCLAKSTGKDSEDDIENIENFLRKAKAKRAKDLVHDEWLAKKKESVMIVASLIAAMAFQAGVNPPGGVWQNDSEKFRAGEAVMAYNYPDSYPYFLRSNTIGFVASLSIILLLISGLPFWKRAFMGILVFIMWLTITSMAFTYAFSIFVVTPKKDRKSLSFTILVAVIAWCSVMALLLLTHVVIWTANLFKEERNRCRAIYEISILSRALTGMPNV